MTGTREEPGQQHVQERTDRKPLSQRLWPISILADIAAVVALLTSSTHNIALVIASLALVLGTVHLWIAFGRTVDRWVIFSIVAIVAGASLITAVATSAMITRAQAGSPTNSGKPSQAPQPSQSSDQPAHIPSTSSPVTTPQESSPPSEPAGGDPSIARASGDKPIALTPYYALDLDSREPYWIAKYSSSSSNPNLSDDLKNASGTLTAPYHLAYMGSKQATLDDCIRAPYKSYSGFEEVVTGAVFCVRTSEGAYGRITLLRAEEQQLMLDAVVWRTSA